MVPNALTASSCNLPKGDFAKNGLSFFIFSYTYTNSAEKWNDYAGTSINPIDPLNQDIANFNGLTKAGGGYRCDRGRCP